MRLPIADARRRSNRVARRRHANWNGKRRVASNAKRPSWRNWIGTARRSHVARSVWWAAAVHVPVRWNDDAVAKIRPCSISRQSMALPRPIVVPQYSMCFDRAPNRMRNGIRINICWIRRRPTVAPQVAHIPYPVERLPQLEQQQLRRRLRRRRRRRQLQRAQMPAQPEQLALALQLAASWIPWKWPCSISGIVNIPPLR